MYQEDLDECTEFTQKLPQLRQQVSDSGLLDQCQTYLSMLIQQMADSNVDLGPRPQPEAPPDQPPAQ